MASNESFRILGFVYGILSVVGSLFEVLKCAVRLSVGQVKCHSRCLNSDGNSMVSYCTLSLPFCALWLMFSIFLVVGIKQVFWCFLVSTMWDWYYDLFQRNIVLVKAHRWFLIISYAIILFVLGIANLLLRMYYKGDDIKLIQMSVVLVLIIMLGMLESDFQRIL